MHLDTGFLIRALIRNSREDAKLRSWLEGKRPIAMSSIAWAEFLCGPIDHATSSLASLIVGHHPQFTEQMARVAAQWFNDTGRRRGTMVDCMVAATAMSEQATLATTNHRDFRRFETLGLEIL